MAILYNNIAKGARALSCFAIFSPSFCQGGLRLVLSAVSDAAFRPPESDMTEREPAAPRLPSSPGRAAGSLSRANASPYRCTSHSCRAAGSVSRANASPYRCTHVSADVRLCRSSTIWIAFLRSSIFACVWSPPYSPSNVHGISSSAVISMESVLK